MPDDANTCAFSRRERRGAPTPPPHRRAFALAVTLVLGMVFLPSALGAQPLAGMCWGTCGGDLGAVGGYFQVMGGKVQGFLDSQRCLGVRQGLENEIRILQPLKITSSGAFSFTGKATTYVGTTKLSIPVTLNGTFVTPALARITLKISHGKCSTATFSVPRHG